MSTNFEDLIGRGNTAGKPAAGVPGRLYFDTDTGKLNRDNGSTWDEVESTASAEIPSNGWTAISGTFTYASATTINVSSGAAAVHSVGEKIRFQNNDSGTYLYVYVIAIADTLLTVVGDAVPNATLTDAYYSHTTSPVGFPHFFSYTPILTATESNPTLNSSTLTGYFNIIGRMVTVGIRLAVAADFSIGSGNYRFSVPTSAVAVVNAALWHGAGRFFDAGVAIFLAECEIWNSGGVDYIAFLSNNIGNYMSHNMPITWANGDLLTGSLSYQI